MAKPVKRLSMAKIKAHKKDLKNIKKIRGYSLQQMVDKYFSGTDVTRQILGRFIKEKDYVPTSESAREALDIYADPNPYRGLPKWYKRTPAALDYFRTQRERITGMYQEQQAQRKAATS